MGNIGIWQILLVLVIILILFGAGKLPKVMGDFAKGIRNFKSGLKDDTDDQETADQRALRSEQTVPTGTTTATVNKDEAAKG
ncbi:twin-arginine translocase TatA/TatE family subunit [Indioceanicola profundi]|uniref:twin-arginine translocase TatA/TatE family subunit n=1 Tax=Indioceanicola profundi TaxID=2220096 RepID=UPI000E6AAB0D|nr:twin-arginine translocase TatA/TatE family subunit [Indioceanicola profundi]